MPRKANTLLRETKKKKLKVQLSGQSKLVPKRKEKENLLNMIKQEYFCQNWE